MPVPEQAALNAAVAALQTAGLLPAPVLIGLDEPVRKQDLPALVVSLDEGRRGGGGLGAGLAVIEKGALQVVFNLSMANPVLADDPSVVLWDAPTRVLTLPHGGLVRRDRADLPLAPGDFDFFVNNDPWTLVNAPPINKQVRVDAFGGRVTLGAVPLPNQTIRAVYHVGQWERTRTQVEGVLAVEVLTAVAATTASLSEAVVEALTTPALRARDPQFLFAAVRKLSSIGLAEAVTTARRRTARFAFIFEHVVDRPASGGVIERIPLSTRTRGLVADGAGHVIEQEVTETGVGVPIPPGE
ncbi:MAG: hypothetical protein KC620_05165 [Myxococcales bacterium]|nr:hypothetical protein [Myxococcales bacterium]